MLSGNFDWVDELGKAEIEPYLPHINTPDYLALPEYKKGGSLMSTNTRTSPYHEYEYCAPPYIMIYLSIHEYYLRVPSRSSYGHPRAART